MKKYLVISTISLQKSVLKTTIFYKKCLNIVYALKLVNDLPIFYLWPLVFCISTGIM